METFAGFDIGFIKFFVELSLNNSKLFFNENKETYTKSVKNPLYLLHNDISKVVARLDGEIDLKPSRCIGSPYTDARFNKANPIKGYIYIRYRLTNPSKQNMAGFFFDASTDNYRYGWHLYNSTADGMNKIRNAIQINPNSFLKCVRSDKIQEFNLVGKEFKKASYPNLPSECQKWLIKRELKIERTSPMSSVFFSNSLLKEICDSFSALADLHNFVKTALLKY